VILPASITAAVRQLEARLPETAPALVAVSGGRDSVLLLRLLLEAGFRRLIVCHLNHGLRGAESGQDAAWVRRLARKHGLLCEVEKIDVAAFAKKTRQSLETAGRAARYDFLARMAARHAAACVYLAHHADDQAETILANLCRGAGFKGLGGMRSESLAAGGLILVRPLLQVRRADIDAAVSALALSYREDSSNQRLDPRRNRLRHKVLPLLSQIFDRDTAPIIARAGAQAARDDECLTSIAASFPVAADIPISPELRALHPAILSRILASWLKDQHGIPGVDHDLVESAMAMLRPGGPAKINLPGGRHLRRRAKTLFVTPA
jgi:tRNA(Ile)-lysidine synthase